MNPSEAKELLQLHSYQHPDLDHPKMRSGFLGCLRPYRGALVEENFHEVMRALRGVAALLEQPQVDQEIINALWGICHLARAWGVAPSGMLRRNSLISSDDVVQLEAWIDCISEATMFLLDHAGSDEAFHDYRSRWASAERGRGFD